MSVLAAALIDWVLGEPPARLHPVAWIGRYLAWAGRGLTSLPPRRAFLAGMVRWIVGATLFTSLFALAASGLSRLPWWINTAGTALLLKPLFAFRMLLTEVRAVDAALEQSLETGRQRLALIVSRDTSSLSAAEVRESALESLSENLSDSVVAPIFWYLLLGLPGAALYRFANTADAMWGYRGAWEWAGKWAARADDVLNFVPARLTALVLMLCGSGTRRSETSLCREARRTPSPNSGWPMAALALRLGVRLGKPGVYTLNASSPHPEAADISRGLRLATSAGAIALILMACARLLLEWRWHHA